MLASFAPAGSPAGASALVCNGKWHLLPASDLHDDVFLQAVSAISVSCAWAMGSFADGTGPLQPLFQHWDGTSWSVVPGADVGTASFLFAVSATPTGTVWAVGS